MQNVDFYSEMADAMNELSEVFLKIGLEPYQIRAVAAQLILVLNIQPDTDKADDAIDS